MIDRLAAAVECSIGVVYVDNQKPPTDAAFLVTAGRHCIDTQTVRELLLGLTSIKPNS